MTLHDCNITPLLMSEPHNPMDQGAVRSTSKMKVRMVRLNLTGEVGLAMMMGVLTLFFFMSSAKAELALDELLALNQVMSLPKTPLTCSITVI
jgi:hypothetical protein